ncbi:hypothetical protein MUY_001146 [Bacillus licheniformis WX-02]|nr:hypothetical protein MUY_001146 [Bacillus licheniformis WX-02]
MNLSWDDHLIFEFSIYSDVIFLMDELYFLSLYLIYDLKFNILV